MKLAPAPAAVLLLLLPPSLSLCVNIFCVSALADPQFLSAKKAMEKQPPKKDGNYHHGPHQLTLLPGSLFHFFWGETTKQEEKKKKF